MAEKAGLIFYLQPIGRIDEKILRLTSQILAGAFGAETRVLPSVKIKKDFPETGSYDAYGLAQAVHGQLRPDSDGIVRGIILGITASGRFYSFDPKTGRYDGPLDGYAAINGAVAIITLATYYDYRDEAETKDLAESELGNLILHETGHIFGATHCGEYCLMRSNGSPLTRFILPKNRPREYCQSCAEKIQRNLQERTRYAAK